MESEVLISQKRGMNNSLILMMYKIPIYSFCSEEKSTYILQEKLWLMSYRTIAEGYRRNKKIIMFIDI